MDRTDDEGVRENIYNDYLGLVRELINSDGSFAWKRGDYPFGAERYAEGIGNDY